VLELPDSARVAAWLNAWLGGAASPDDVISGLLAHQAHVVFRGFGDQPLPPALLLGRLRADGVTRASVALPVSAEGVGLAGPPAFNLEAHEAGQAVLLHGTGTGLVPRTVGGSTSWHALPASAPSYLPDVASADRDLREALRVSADALADLDVAAWSPDVADALLNLRRPAEFDAPVTFASPEATRCAVQGARCLAIVTMSEANDGGAVSATQASARREALVPLARAARTAVVAACSSLDGR